MINTINPVLNYEKILSDIKNKATEHYKTIGLCGEGFFNIGIELGRLLESNNIQEHRLQMFMDIDNNIAELKNRLAHIARVENIVGFFIANAIAQQIESHGSFKFSSSFSLPEQEKLDESISSKFCLQIIRTKQQEYGGNFQVDLEFNGEIADIFRTYGISSKASFEVDNDSGHDHETIYCANAARKISNATINLDARDTDLDDLQLISLTNSLQRIQLSLLISIGKVQSFRN